jgi:hypothetical protein
MPVLCRVLRHQQDPARRQRNRGDDGVKLAKRYGNRVERAKHEERHAAAYESQQRAGADVQRQSGELGQVKPQDAADSLRPQTAVEL